MNLLSRDEEQEEEDDLVKSSNINAKAINVVMQLMNELMDSF